ncbi:MAG: SOS response-associated peptidase [Cytophagales bacterium]|nr:SOS response-associated peptidase [Armatimonadota bacterium]
MCGRFTLHHNLSDVQDRFSVQASLFDPLPRYNLAPQQTVAVVVAADDGARVLDGFQWGLIPSWAKDPRIGGKMINARSETVAEKPSFRGLLARRRCIVPSDGFFEWEKTGGIKQPFHFRSADGGLFGFAGLWDEWESPDGSPIRTCTILTTSANETVGRVHDRMPVILAEGDGGEALWLDPTLREREALLALLHPFADSEMEAVAVSRRVNSPAHDDPSCLEPIGPPPQD